jgi:hypothetical protein
MKPEQKNLASILPLTKSVETLKVVTMKAKHMQQILYVPGMREEEGTNNQVLNDIFEAGFELVGWEAKTYHYLLHKGGQYYKVSQIDLLNYLYVKAREEQHPSPDTVEASTLWKQVHTDLRNSTRQLFVE